MTVTVKRWRRYGKDRLYVADDGLRLGWHDLTTGNTVVEVEGRAADLHAAIAVHLPQQRTPQQGGDTTPPIASRADAEPPLVEHSAGHLARERANMEWELAKQRSKIRAYASRIVGANTDERSWRLGAEGEELVGKALQRLPEGWLSLHSVEVGQRDSDIDHVVIGPAGVFTINTKNHPDKRVAVYPNAVYVNGSPVPYLRNSRHEARRAARLLSAKMQWAVPVMPVLVFVHARNVTIAKGGPLDVLVVDRQLVKRLVRRPSVLRPDQVDEIWHAARRPEVWSGQAST